MRKEFKLIVGVIVVLTFLFLIIVFAEYLLKIYLKNRIGKTGVSFNHLDVSLFGRVKIKGFSKKSIYINSLTIKISPEEFFKAKKKIFVAGENILIGKRIINELEIFLIDDEKERKIIVKELVLKENDDNFLKANLILSNITLKDILKLENNKMFYNYLEENDTTIKTMNITLKGKPEFSKEIMFLLKVKRGKDKITIKNMKILSLIRVVRFFRAFKK